MYQCTLRFHECDYVTSYKKEGIPRECMLFDKV